MSSPSDSTKAYTDRGVQTDVVSSTPLLIDSSSYTSLPETVPSPASSPLSSHSIMSTQFDSAYTQGQTDISFESISSSADHSMTTTTRGYKIQLPANRPTALLHRQPSSRIVSLPEATPKFQEKVLLEKKTARIVSMPVSSTQDHSSDSLEGSSDVIDHFLCDDEERSRVRVHSHATDVPHTPSVPSSPDSVVIIANNSNPLSSDFLRRDVGDETPPESDDEGKLPLRGVRASTSPSLQDGSPGQSPPLVQSQHCMVPYLSHMPGVLRMSRRTSLN